MSDYKRLTERKENGAVEYEDRNGYFHTFYSGNDGDPVHALAWKLAELEDKIEQGTLVELPCNVGTWVYCIAGCFKGFFRRKYVYGVVECPFDITMVDSYKNNWFLTKDEAEARLKELQEKQK